MTTKKHPLLPLAAAMVTLTSVTTSASAAMVAFDANTGGADTGFTGGWTGSGNVFITASTDLTYANYGITQTGTPGNVYASNAGPDRQDKRTVATPMSGTIWFSALVNVPANANYGGLTINNFNAGQPWNPITTDLRVLLTPSALTVGFNGDPTTTGTGSFSPGTHLLLGQMNIVAGNDTLSVWVDPDVNAAGSPGGLPAANFTSTTIDFTDSLENLGVAGSKGAALTNVEVDAIRLSDTATAFQDVTGVVAIPEPSAFALFGLGGLALILRRRK